VRDISALNIEKQVLGCLMIYPHLLEHMSKLSESLFDIPTHKEIFKAIKSLVDEGQGVDLVTLHYKAPKIDITYLTDMGADILTDRNFETYIEQLKRNSTVSSIAALGDYVKLNAQKDDVLENTEKRIDEIRDLVSNNSLTSARELAVSAFENIESRYNSNELKGLDTGFLDLNRVLDGLTAGYHIIAGRPAMGKTALALDIARNAAVKKKKSVAVFSLEMPKDKLMERILHQESLLNKSKINGKKMQDDDWAKLVQSASAISNSNLFIADDLFSISEIKTECMKLKRTAGLDLVVIDYLQLMQVEKSDRREGLEEVSRGIVRLWKELGCPVLVLSQLSRGCEMRTDKRPMLSDLRETGQIEQDADTVMFVYRDEYYYPDTDKKNIAEVIIGKNRYGETGRIDLVFAPEMTKFLNIVR